MRNVIAKVIGGVALAGAFILGIGATVSQQSAPPYSPEVEEMLERPTVVEAPVVETKSEVVAPVKEPVALKEVPHPDDYVEFTYTVTQIEGSDYYGSASDGTGIYFTDDYLSAEETVEVGQKVIAVFEADNTVDGLVEVIGQ